MIELISFEIWYEDGKLVICERYTGKRIVFDTLAEVIAFIEAELHEVLGEDDDG